MRKITSIDIIVILAIGLFSCLYQINRMAGNSLFLFQSSDAADIASFAAAKDNPDLFLNDELFLNTKEISILYPPIQVFLIKQANKITNDYATAYVLLLGFHIFLQALGFYIFGRILFQSRYWAALLAVITTVHFPIAMGDFWGMYYDSLPRLSFSMILPYLLASILYWRDKPGVWLLVLFVTGTSTSVHALSVPTWGFSLWLGLWFLHPEEWRLRKRIGIMLLAGLAFVAGALPYAFQYLANHIQNQVRDYGFVFEAMKYRLGKSHLSIAYALERYFSNIAFVRVLVFGIAGWLYLWIRHHEERKKLSVILLWILGIVFTSIAIPFLEHLLITIKYEKLPLQVSLIRNFKYIFPLMLICCLWPFAVISKSSSSAKKRKIAIVLGFLLVFAWSSRQMYKHIVFLVKNGYTMFNTYNNKSMETIDALNALKRITPAGSRILTIAFPHEHAVRYYALRPLAHSAKDGGVFLYTSHTRLIEWYKNTKDLNDMVENPQKPGDKERLNTYLDFCRRLKVEFLLIGNDHFSNKSIKEFAPDADIAYSNDAYSLIKVEKKR